MNGKSNVLLLIFACSMLLMLSGCQKNTDKQVLTLIPTESTKIDDNYEEIIDKAVINEELPNGIEVESSGEQPKSVTVFEEERYVKTDEGENVSVKVLNSEEINSLKSAEMPDYSQNKKIEFFTLTPFEKKVINLNGNEITLDMYIDEYTVSRAESAGGNYIFLCNYVVNIAKGSDNYYGSFSDDGWEGSLLVDFYDEDSQEKISDVESAIKSVGIQIGVFKDSVTNQEYLLCVDYGYYNTDEDLFFIYNEKGSLIYKGIYNQYFGRSVAIDSKGDTLVDGLELYENQIICYDLYMDFENGKEMNIEKEIVNLEKNYYSNNVVHRLTIENGVFKDRIIKIYENVASGWLD